MPRNPPLQWYSDPFSSATWIAEVPEPAHLAGRYYIDNSWKADEYNLFFALEEHLEEGGWTHRAKLERRFRSLQAAKRAALAHYHRLRGE